MCRETASLKDPGVKADDQNSKPFSCTESSKLSVARIDFSWAFSAAFMIRKSDQNLSRGQVKERSFGVTTHRRRGGRKGCQGCPAGLPSQCLCRTFMAKCASRTSHSSHPSIPFMSDWAFRIACRWLMLLCSQCNQSSQCNQCGQCIQISIQVLKRNLDGTQYVESLLIAFGFGVG